MKKMVPNRGDDYYKPGIFRVRHESLLKEQAEGISCFYLIKDENGSILGRINLIDINEIQKIGYLGYRIGQLHTGKGVAKKALKLLLEGNGFVQTESNDEEFEMNGQSFKFTNYIWTNKVFS